MAYRCGLFAVACLLFLSSIAEPAAGRERGVSTAATATSLGLEPDVLDRIGPLVEEAIRNGETPGCVVAIGRRDGIAYLECFGQRQQEPSGEPMTRDTVFDLASLTKPVATATSVMQLVEEGLLSLDDTIGSHLSGFSAHGKDSLTVRDLLTHTSGLIADNPLADYEQGPEEAWRRICGLKPLAARGERFIYSDVNFIVLGRLVEELRGTSLAAAAHDNIFEPLQMVDAGFTPDATRQQRAAPTEKRNGEWIKGEVHDPRSWKLNGIAGHAGLFATADDLARYARAMLAGGSLDGTAVVSPQTLATMNTAVEVPGGGLRGLGWDKQSGYSSNRGGKLSPSAFGHGGFTGTSLWIDPELDLFVIFLGSRLHPDGKGRVNPLAGAIADVAVESIATTPREQAAATASSTPKRPPNVLVILADDAGWGDFSVTGNQSFRTPNVDAIAADGCLLETFFVQPVCAPTRAELLTGRWHARGGVRGVTEGQERMSPDERTIAEVFRDGGYETGCFGKWHNGTQWPYHPLARGFERFYGFTEGHWGSYFNPPMESDSEFVRGTGFITDDITDKAIDFVKANTEAPFLCYVAYNTPHSPMSVPDDDWARYEDLPLAQTRDREDPTFTRAALALVENLDTNVGRLLDTLESCELTNDTIVVFFSDNGPNSFRWCGGMRGRKGSTDDGGVRSVCCVRWPETIAAGSRLAEPTAAIDLLPTLAGLAGVSTAGCRPLDGVSLAPLLAGQGNTASLLETLKQRPIVSSFRGKVSIRTATHRLDHEGQLYNMVDDPGQTTDITDADPQTAAQLKAIAKAWRREVLDTVPVPEVERFPVGFAGAPQTELPARDGRGHGGVERSGRAPNCSFFTNWTSPDDRITWTVDVLTPGSYEAVLWYTCPEESTGATIALTCEQADRTPTAAQQVTGVIREAWDPPLNLGEDRVDRGAESYDKPFRTLSLGPIDLPAGEATLSLLATDVPGGMVADIRRLVLRPVAAQAP